MNTDADVASTASKRRARLSGLGRPRFLVGLLAATLITGVATALFEVKIGLGIVGALGMFIVVLQFEMLFAISGDDEEAKAKLRALAPIVALNEHDPEMSHFLVRLAAAHERDLKSAHRPKAFDAELTEERRALLRRYEECAKGSMRVDLRPSAISRETDAASMLETELLATSLVDPVDYWDVPVGLKYLREQEDKLKRGATIRRIFIEKEASLAPLCKVVAQHLAWRADGLAADCRIALIGKVQQHLIGDYAVVDEETVIRLETPRGLDVPSFAVWETDPDIIESQSKSFERLWEESEKPDQFTEFAPGH